MTPRYIAFILTKNCFGQTWAGMANQYYMAGPVGKCIDSQEKKCFLKISTLFFVLRMI